jgi:hypothetical protein
MSEYPQHDALKVIQPLSQACGAFLEWLGEQGYVLCKHYHGNYAPAGISRDHLLAEHFEIDLEKLEEEKRAMLRSLNPDFGP